MTKQSKRRLLVKRVIAGLVVATVLAFYLNFHKQLFDLTPSYTIVDRSGHIWTISTTFNGVGEIYSPSGRFVGRFGNTPFMPSVFGYGAPVGDDWQVAIATRGQHFTITGLGPHLLFDQRQKVLGLVALESQNPLDFDPAITDQPTGRMPEDFVKAAEWSKQFEQASGKPFGASSNIWSVYGFDSSANFYWFVRGIVSASMNATGGIVTTANADIAGREEQLSLLGYAMIPKNSNIARIVIINGSSMKVFDGYGVRTFVSQDHKSVIRLDVEPIYQLDKQEANIAAYERLRALDHKLRINRKSVRSP